MRQIFSVLVSVTLIAHLGSCQQYVPSGGPVYVNPNQQQPQAQINNDAVSPLLTQTVYGFLDFTTTIGNTVMIFSPQSAPPAGEKKEEVKAVIETKPPTTAPPVEIKPSKISVQKVSDDDKLLSSINEIKSAPVLSSIVEIRSDQESHPVEHQDEPLSVKEKRSHEKNQIVFSKVEVREGSSAIKEVPKGLVGKSAVYSKVEVREGPSQTVNIKEQISSSPPRIISSIVEVIGGETTKVIEPPRILSSVVQVIGGDDNEPQVTPTQRVHQPLVALSSHVEVVESVEEPTIQGNNIFDPEYDFLSRQPSEVVDQTFKVINLRPSSKFHLKHKPSAKADDQPTGLISKMGGTIVKDGVTTVHETKVIGTIISGKYTQVLQSSSKIKPTPSARILRTAGPTGLGKGRLAYLEPSPAGSNREETIALPLEALFSSAANSNHIRGTKRPVGGSRNRFNLRNKLNENREQDLDDNEDDDYIEPPPKKVSKPARPAPSQRNAFRTTKGYSKFARTSTPELATVSVFPESTTVAPRFKQQRRPGGSGGGYRPPSSPSVASDTGHSRRYKPKASPVEHERTTSTSLYKFKLSRPQGRWQYKTTPKPRVTIRRSDDGLENVTTTSPAPQPQYNPEQRAELRERNEDVDDVGEEIEGLVQEVKEPIVEAQPSTVVAETIKVEISTPADFKDVYYELATIRSPYTFQVGTVKNTRYITVTSTFEKSLVEPTIDMSSEPLTENILATTLAPHYTQSLPLDSSIATLPPIALASDVETPPLETLTETFSTTQLLLKTHILPVIHQGSPDTTSYTLVQSYHVTRFVTAIKTLPPMEAYSFHPSRTLTDLNTRLEEAGSELHLELEFGDENNSDSDEPAALRALRPDIDLANIGSDLDIADLDKVNLPEGHLRHKKTPEPLPKIATVPKIPAAPKFEQSTPQYSPEQLQQLALLRFLNPAAAAAAIPQFVTSSRPVYKVETVYESHVLPLFDGVTTHYSTLSRPVGTITKTEYELVTSTVAPPLPNINALFPQQAPQQFAVTSTPVVTQTMVTATESKVLKLTFGAKTAYTTLFSTRVIPTVLTTYVTASVPVQGQAAAYNPFFPSPFQQIPQFPFGK